MLKKYFYSLLFLIICNATYTMKMEVKTINQYSFLIFLEDIQHIVFSYAIGNWQYNKTEFDNAITTCKALQLTCTHYAPLSKIAQYMNINDANKDILLIRASQAGIPCLVKYAIAQKAHLNYIEKPFGYTPLLRAVHYNNYTCCKILLEAGADVNKREEDENEKDPEYLSIGYMPIHLAILNNNLKIAKLLIDHKADVNASTSIVSSYPLSMAREYSNQEMMILLLQNGSIVPQWLPNDLLKQACLKK